MNYLLLAFIAGLIGGLRTVMPVAAVSWAAFLGRLPLAGTWMSFLGAPATPWIMSLLAVLELVNDKLPKTPSRKVPAQFAARVLSGAFAGAAIGTPAGAMLPGALVGAIGAVAGMYGGAALRGALAKSFGRDLPAALIEDALAVVGAVLLVTQLG